MPEFPRLVSTFNPFMRRFTNERRKELDEAAQLYAWVKSYDDTFDDTVETVAGPVYRECRRLPDPLDSPLLNCLLWTLEYEPYLKPLPPPDFERMSLKEFVEYRNLLEGKAYFYKNREEVLEHLHDALARIFCGIADQLPDAEAPSPFTIPLAFALPQPAIVIDKIHGTMEEPEYRDRGLFRTTSRRLYENLCRVSGREPDQESKKPWKNADESGLPLGQLADAYLAGTPFHDLFTAPVPLRLTREDRFNHMHIVGGTGAGKTTLIENLILHDLHADDPPSLVIVDPHRDLIGKLLRADLGIEDRLIIIDPRDIEHPPALNIFALNQERLAGYDEATREQVTAGVIQTFDYLFSGLIGADLTAKQGVFFRYVARLMLSLPDTMGRNATILDMLKLMSDATPYRAAMESLPDIPREFFLNDFPSKTFQQTREQIRYRLQAILENPTMARLFTSPETKVDLFTEMNRGAVILVDTAKDYLKSASPNFGRIFISLVLQAVLERAAIPAKDRKDTFLIVDEAASYFDSNIDDLLTDARKYHCGCVFAHQYLDQASSSLKASLAANTGTKFASGLSSGDARSMAPDLRTTADFILGQPKLQFAAHIRNVTPHAVSIPVTPGVLDRLPRLSGEARAELMQRNRERVSLGPAALPAGTGAVSPQSAEEDDNEW